MANPFKYGTVVSGDDFADRQKELKDLAAKLKETVRIFLLAPRRYGKTSLIKGVLNRLKRKGFLVVYLDLYWASSSEEFFDRGLCLPSGSGMSDDDLERVVQEIQKIIS